MAQEVGPRLKGSMPDAKPWIDVSDVLGRDTVASRWKITNDQSNSRVV